MLNAMDPAKISAALQDFIRSVNESSIPAVYRREMEMLSARAAEAEAFCVKHVNHAGGDRTADGLPVAARDVIASGHAAITREVYPPHGLISDRWVCGIPEAVLRVEVARTGRRVFRGEATDRREKHGIDEGLAPADEAGHVRAIGVVGVGPADLRGVDELVEDHVPTFTVVPSHTNSPPSPTG